MLQRSSLPSSVPTEITTSLQQTFNRRWLESLQEILWLPENSRQYLILLAITLLIGAGMMVHVQLGVQIAEQRYQVASLTAEQQQIERANSDIIYAIAETTSLYKVRQVALEQGYRPTTQLLYIRRDEVTASSIPGLHTAQSSLPARPALPAPSPAVERAAPESVAMPDRASPTNEVFDAIGRGLGAAGDWLGEQARNTTEVVGDLTAGFTERWMR
jgi:hypothetical protein